MAPARTLTAAATRIRETPALTRPLEGFAARVLDIDSSVLLSIRIMIPMAERDLTISPTSNLDIDLRDAVRTPTATAMLTSELILIPVENDCNESCRASRAPVIFDLRLPSSSPFLKMLDITSLILSMRPENFLAATNIPPPARPAKISAKEKLSPINVNAALIPERIFPATVTIPSPIKLNTSLKPLIFSVAPLSTLEIPVTIVERTSVIPSAVNPSFSFVK